MTARIRALIADDEPACRRTLQLLLADDPDIQVVGQSRTGQETVEMLLRTRPDLLFLDVQMPGGDGFDALAQVPAMAMPLVVFVTAFDDYAVQAFGVEASDYLLKPFSNARFRTAVARAKERLKQRTASDADRVANVLGRLGTFPRDGTDRQRAPARLIVRSGHGTVILLPDDIEWVEAHGDHVKIHLVGNRAELMREPIGRFEERLDQNQFIRVHRSAIVNLNRVRAVRRLPTGETVAVLTSGIQCRMSESGRERLSGVLGQAL